MPELNNCRFLTPGYYRLQEKDRQIQRFDPFHLYPTTFKKHLVIFIKIIQNFSGTPRHAS